jgi:hypothetical protein
MVRFFGGVLSSLMGCFPLSAMALGFSPLEQEEKMWGDRSVCEWICRATRGAILLTVRVHWEWSPVGVRYWNTKRQGFLPECEGFSLNSVYGSRVEDFLRILCQGVGVFACSAKKSSRIRSKTVKFAFMSRGKSSQYKHRSWNFIIYCRKLKHP